MKHRIFTTLALASFGAATLLADFSYQETTKMTGGAMLSMMRMMGPFARGTRDPVVSTVMVKGNRMATIHKDSASVIDLDKETITSIDFTHKTYSVMTFAEMKQAMEDAMQRMKQSRQGSADVNFKVSAKTTGQTKQINGVQAKEIILTLVMESSDQQSGQKGGMKMDVDSWFGPAVPGYDEVKNFYRKMGEKMSGFMPGGSPLGPMGAGRPDMSKAFEQAAQEMAKMDGIPVLRVTTMTGAGGPQQQQQPQGQQPAASSEDSGARPGRFGLPGGFGGFGRKKQQDQPQQSQQAGTLLETTTELSGFSSDAVDASKFEVPAGFKQVEPEMLRRGRR